MRVLITGANGLIGQALGQELVRRGHEVTALVREPQRARQKMSYLCKLFKWDGHEIESSALEGIEAVVHLAGESVAGTRWTAAKKKAIRDSRIDGTRALVSAMSRHAAVQKNLKCFVQSSAIGFYGDRSSDWVSETDAPGKGFLAEVCRDWEAEGAKIKALAPAIRHVSMRTGIVLSEKGGALSPLLKLFSNGGGARLGNGEQWMSWIHLDDIVGLYMHALETPAVDGPLNAVAPNPVTNREFTQELASDVHQWTLPPVPKLALKITMGEMATMVLDSERVSSERAAQLGYQFKFTKLHGALKEICRDMQAGSAILVSEQWVPAKLKDVFKYFSDAANLEELTPKYLNFEIRAMSTSEIKEGSLIDYRLRLHGIPMSWRTRIDVWKPMAQGDDTAEFVDRQLSGPYQQWYHTHEFETLGQGTLIRDRVVYKLPLGAAGRAVAGFKVASDVKGIFDYRRHKIAETF